MSLNPCFRGSWFDGNLKSNQKSVEMTVLILVFVEVGLMGHLNKLVSRPNTIVLILVFVEVGLMDLSTIIKK